MSTIKKGFFLKKKRNDSEENKSESCNIGITSLNLISSLYTTQTSKPATIPEDDGALIELLCKCDENLQHQTEFKGTYKSDYNILNIHYSILYNFNTYYKKELEKCWNQINNKNLDNITQYQVNPHEKIKEIENQVEKTKYLERTLPFLLAYKRLKPLTLKISTKSVQDDENSDFKHEIISKYIDIASDYITIDLIRIFETSGICKRCANSIKDYDEYSDETCPHCGIEFNSIFKVNHISFDTGNLHKNNYTDDSNFEKAILRFEGKQANKLPENLFKDLDEYFVSYNFEICIVVKTWEFDEENDCRFKINEKGIKISLNRNIMIEALGKTGNSDYYNDMNLILHLYWGFPLPDISNVKEGIREDYAKTQKVFNEMDKNRTSSLNSDFRLLKHLQLRGYKCKKTQFKIIRTKQIQQEYEILWKKMCEGADLDYIPTDW